MALYFSSGSTEYVVTSGNFTPPSATTVSFWMYAEDLSGSHRIFGSDTDWEVRFSGNDLLNEIYGGSLETSNLNAFQIYHVAATRSSGGTAQNYIDGILANSQGGHNDTPGTDNLAIGTSYWNSGQSFEGSLEDFRIYNRVLSAGEIQTIYSCRGTDKIYDGLLHRWLLSEGPEGTTASGSGFIKDYSNNKLNLNPVNTPTYVARITKRSKLF